VPASTRRTFGAVVAATGIALAVVGAWIVVMLGPSGEAYFSATAQAPGAIVVPAGVVNAVDVPVRVTATRRDGGAVRLAEAPTVDARALLATSAVSTVTAVHYPAGTLDLRTSGSGALTDVSTADVWRLAAEGAGSASLVVNQGSDRGAGPETVVITSGDATALHDVTVTLTWASRTWFFQALALTTFGAVIAAFAFNDLWQGRSLVVTRDVAQAPAVEAAP
jgi:hypothetical protein